MSGRPENIFRTDINDRYVEKYDQNISKIRKCPEISKLQSCDITEDTKCGNKKTDTAYKINQEEIIMADFKFKKSGLFAAGVLFGTAGIKILTSKDAKKLYTGCTAAVLRAKDCIMKTATNLQENAEDIYAEAKEINEERAAAEEAVEDVETEAEETADEDAFKETAEETAE